MKCILLFGLAIWLAQAAGLSAADSIEHFDTMYNSLTVERDGSIVELRARSRRGEALESAVDLSDPLKLVVPYTRTLYGGLFFQPEPKRVLMIGLGGAGFHRLFVAAFPTSLLHTIELDPKVVELCKTHLGFEPTEHTPVTTMDGRMFVKRNRESWDWIILDAFRGGYVPPHLKTEEFYRECAERLGPKGVFITNLHSSSELYYSDIKTIAAVFPQVVLLATKDRGNVIAFAAKYREPAIANSAAWPTARALDRPPFAGHLDLGAIRAEQIEIPKSHVAAAKVLTDDFSPVEFLDAIKAGDTAEK
jgi:spermidine synthase